MGNRYQDRHQYFDEMVETSTAFYVDYLRQFIPIAEGIRVLEVGCGEGGNLLPFALIGCEVTGVDFSGKKIENARNYFQVNGAEGVFICADFFDFPVQDKRFDVILVHDVIEHIAPEDKKRFLERIHTFLDPKGVAFLAFPAWQMPFGGHQQTCVRKGVRIFPWIHLLPMPVYRGILRPMRFRLGLDRIPYLRNWLSTSCWYVIRRTFICGK